MPAARQPPVLAIAAAALLVPHWSATLVNQEVRRPPRDGTLRLCQAIPPVTLGPVLRWTARPARRVEVRLRGPKGTRAVRRLTLRPARGRQSVAFAPASLGLDAFAEGTYRVRVRASGRTLATARLRVVGRGRC